jgi:hypothetical protein
MLADFINDRLDVDARDTVDKHLAGCSQCVDTLTRKFAEGYQQKGNVWWTEYVTDQMIKLLALVPNELDKLLSVLKVSKQDIVQAGQTIKLPIFKRTGDDQLRLAASTGEGLAEQRFRQDNPPFEFHLVQFGKQLRIDIHAEGEDSEYRRCLGRLEFMEGQTARYSRIIHINNGTCQCILEPGEAMTILPEAGELTIMFIPLVTLADLEVLGSDAYRPMLAVLLRHNEPQIRKASVEVAARIYGPDVKSLITHMAEDDDQSVRQAVEKALNQFPEQ